MKKNHLVVAAAAAGILGMTLAGCSNGTGGGGDENTLTISATTNETAALDQAIAAFKDANPDVDVQVDYAGVDQYQTTIKTQLSSGTAADVYFVWPGVGGPFSLATVAEAGFLTDQSDKAWAAEIPAGLKPVLTYDDKAWIAPITFTGIGAIYNTTALDEVGLTAPDTWSSLLQFCSDATAQGKTAFALGGKELWVTQLIPYALAPTLVYGQDSNFNDELVAGDATFSDSAWTEAFDKYKEMQDAGCFQADVLGTSYEASLTSVAKGDALATVQVNSAASAITQQAPDGTELELAALPATDDASQTLIPGAAGSAYGVNSKAKNPELAERFLDFLEEPAQVAAYATTASALPAIPNDEFVSDPALDALAQYQTEGRTYPFVDQEWPNGRVQQALQQGSQDLLGGKATTADVLKSMDAAYTQQ